MGTTVLEMDFAQEPESKQLRVRAVLHGGRKMTPVSASTISETLDHAFRAALFLTGDADLAENAVLDGIAALESNDTVEKALVVKTVESVIRQRADFPTHTEQAMARLPPELQRLIGLAPVSRDCFILRVLFGISPVNCAAILNLSSEEFKESLCAAYQQLPALGDKTCSPVGLARSGGITTTPTLPGNR
jgi:hypothetical protein